MVGDFEIRAQAVIVTSSGIGANHDLVRRNWPSRLGAAPTHLLSGVPDHVDGRMLAVAGSAGARIINPDRVGKGAPPPLEAFMKHGVDFIVERQLEDLVRRMNSLTAEPLLDYSVVERAIRARDRARF